MESRFLSFRLWRVLIVAWLAYVAYIMGRKPVSIVRSEITAYLSPIMSGLMDTAFLTTYSLGQFLYVTAKGRIPIRSILLGGLLGSSLCVALFGMVSHPFLMLVLWGLNGGFQSIGWPCCIAIVTPWIGAAERGWIMGVWGSCQAVGGIVGNWLSAFLLGSMGWRVAFYGDAAAMALVCGVILLYLADHPNRFEMVSPSQAAKGLTWESLRYGAMSLDGEVEAHEEPNPGNANSVNHETMTPLQALRVPGVLGMSLSYFCQKIIRYTLLFWLPFYLTKELGYSAVLAGYTSAAFDVGGVIGSVLSGVFSDWFQGGKRRVLSCTVFILSGLVCLLMFSLFKTVMMESIAVCCLISGGAGFFFFGCDTLMTGATLQDVAERNRIPQHTSSLSGVVGGVGSIGAILQGVLTTAIALEFGWGSMFYFLCVLAVLAALCMMTPVRLEKEYNEKKKGMVSVAMGASSV